MTEIFVPPERIFQILRKTPFSQLQVNPEFSQASVDASRGCLKPLVIELVSDITPRDVSWRFHPGWFSGPHWEPVNSSVVQTAIRAPFVLNMAVSCRTKCEVCLDRRSRLWSQRAFFETKKASRTWFVTLTVRPELRLRARILSKTGTYPAICKIVGEWFTKYMKRLRKSAGVSVRYLLAFEPHADGFPHLHLLIHERGGQVSKRLIEAQWRPLGITSCELVDEFRVSYVTKYISKYLTGRIRSSQNYGRPNDIDPDDWCRDFLDPSLSTMLGILEKED